MVCGICNGCNGHRRVRMRGRGSHWRVWEGIVIGRCERVWWLLESVGGYCACGGHRRVLKATPI